MFYVIYIYSICCIYIYVVLVLSPFLPPRLPATRFVIEVYLSVYLFAIPLLSPVRRFRFPVLGRFETSGFALDPTWPSASRSRSSPSSHLVNGLVYARLLDDRAIALLRFVTLCLAIVSTLAASPFAVTRPGTDIICRAAAIAISLFYLKNSMKKKKKKKK